MLHFVAVNSAPCNKAGILIGLTVNRYQTVIFFNLKAGKCTYFCEFMYLLTNIIGKEYSPFRY